MARLRMTLVVEWSVPNCAEYNADDIHQAAVNQQEWLDAGEDPLEVIAFAEDVISTKVEAVE